MAELPESFKLIPVLTPDECKKARDIIYTLQPRWRSRITKYPFFTLGAASYLDAPLSKEIFLQRASEDNPLLLKNFQWIYDKLLAVLGEFFKEPVLFDPKFTVPGFHIFQAHEAFTQPLASMHFDLQYNNFDWSPRYKNVERSKVVSMTLPIALPSTGAGLRVWDMTYERSLEMPEAAFDDYKKTAPFTYHPYEVGRMLVHSGHYLHQIAPLNSFQQGEERITLQAHAVRTELGWVVYW